MKTVLVASFLHDGHQLSLTNHMSLPFCTVHIMDDSKISLPVLFLVIYEIVQFTLQNQKLFYK